MSKRGRGLGHMTYFSNFAPPSISGTAEDTNIKFCTENILNKKCKTGQNLAWLRSRATSRFRDILNIQATEALKNGKIRESIAFDFQHDYVDLLC